MAILEELLKKKHPLEEYLDNFSSSQFEETAVESLKTIPWEIYGQQILERFF